MTVPQVDVEAKYRALLDLAERIGVQRDVPALVDEVAAALRGVVPFDGITLTLYSPSDATIRLYAARTPDLAPVVIGRTFPVAATPAAMVMDNGEPFYVPDLQSDFRFPLVHGLMRSIGVASYVVLPMRTARHSFLGGLNFASAQPYAYSEPDIAFLRQVARQVAVAVENALNYDHLKTLLDIQTAVASELDTDALIRTVVERLKSQLGEISVTVGPDELPGIPLVSRGRRVGTLQTGELPPELAALAREVAAQIAIPIDNAQLHARLAQQKLYLEDEIRTQYRFEEVIGGSPALMQALKAVETVAPSDSAVVVTGETGTGKELIARAIHDLSARSRGTFVKLNCAAIPTGLLESELFGHERGAFTGAIARRIGRFELAHGGTLFLDEIGEIPLELQPKLLRVLQEGEFERLGSGRTIKVDVRIVSATNRDLLAMVRERQFRDDLYYRLNVFPIHLPPLRERADDIPLLVRHFTQRFARRMRKDITTISAATMESLMRYPWPGNVRELQNLVEHSVIVSDGPELRVPVQALRLEAAVLTGAAQTLADADREHILATLRATNWTLAGPGGAAARLGMKRSTLQFRMKKLGIERPR